MKAIAIAGIAGLVILAGIGYWELRRADEAIERRLARCEADVMQWSKLAEYAAEFHAVPDSTAPLDTLAVTDTIKLDTIRITNGKE